MGLIDLVRHLTCEDPDKVITGVSDNAKEPTLVEKMKDYSKSFEGELTLVKMLLLKTNCLVSGSRSLHSPLSE